MPRDHKVKRLNGRVFYSDTFYDERVCPHCSKAFFPREPIIKVCAVCSLKNRRKK